MNKEVAAYHIRQEPNHKAMCETLFAIIHTHLPDAENKIWHGAPVWFIDGNPVVGYDVLKDSVRLLFWSGQSFNEPKLQQEGSFKAAEMRYTDEAQIDSKEVARWVEKAKTIQWDYKNIVKRRGALERLI